MAKRMEIHINDPDIAITGFGVVSAIGCEYHQFAESVMSNKSGISPGELFDYAKYKGRLAAEVKDFNPGLYLPRRGINYLDRSALFVCAAASQAIQDAGLVIESENRHRIGVIGCSSFGCLKSISDFDIESLVGESPLCVSPMDFPNTAMNSAVSNISIYYEITGYNTTMLGGFTSCLEAIAHGRNMLRMGRLDAVLIACVEDLSEQYYIYNKALGIVSDSDSLTAPFDKSSNGTLMGEGSVVMVLENADKAKKEGRSIRATIKGIGQQFTGGSNSNYLDIPTPSGYSSALRKALENAHIGEGEIDLISASANGCREFDDVEAEAINITFSVHSPAVTAVKSMIGETASASAAFSTLTAVVSIERQCVPYIVGLNESSIPLNYISKEMHEMPVNNALITSMDPNGNCMAMVVSRFD